MLTTAPHKREHRHALAPFVLNTWYGCIPVNVIYRAEQLLHDKGKPVVTRGRKASAHADMSHGSNGCRTELES